jgi:restriction system protein
MSLWLFRAGKSGEHEAKFLDDGRVYLTWEGLTQNLATVSDKKALYELLNNTFPNNKIARIRNWGGQIWPIANEMKVGDWVALPSKTDSVIHFGEITGDYVNTPQNQSPYYHYRNVNWFAKSIPRKVFEQDIINSLGALPTICRIKRNDAENRVRELAQNNWNLPQQTITNTNASIKETIPAQPSLLTNNATDFAQLGRAQITDFIAQHFSEERLTLLVNAILEAQGYSTIISSAPGKEGVDILASSDKSNNKLCVQVHDDALNRLSLYQIMGAMQNFNAQKGLLVTWHEVTIQVSDEIPNQAFNLEIWDKDTLVNKLMNCYSTLSDEIKAQIPLKRSWSLSLVS